MRAPPAGRAREKRSAGTEHTFAGKAPRPPAGKNSAAPTSCRQADMEDGSEEQTARLQREGDCRAKDQLFAGLPRRTRAAPAVAARCHTEHFPARAAALERRRKKC